MTVSTGGADITGGINNNNGGITNTGAIAGASSITATGTITGDILNGVSGIQLNGISIAIIDSKCTVRTGWAKGDGRRTIRERKWGSTCECHCS